VTLDDLALACRLSGLSLGDLWWRYLEVGGNRSRAELAARLAGTAWPEADDRFLAVVADEALREVGLPQFIEAAVPVGPLLDLGGPASDLETVRRTTAAVLETRAHGVRLSELFDRCAVARAHARGVRQHARSVRAERHASG